MFSSENTHASTFLKVLVREKKKFQQYILLCKLEFLKNQRQVIWEKKVHLNENTKKKFFFPCIVLVLNLDWQHLNNTLIASGDFENLKITSGIQEFLVNMALESHIF